MFATAHAPTVILHRKSAMKLFALASAPRIFFGAATT